MPRFVIHKHSRGQSVHWDLMLEAEDCLQTWRIKTPPDNFGSEPVEAEKIFAHDKKFLTYQGAVNDGKGCVEIVDSGEFKIEAEDENKMVIIFDGKILTNNRKINFHIFIAN